MATVPNGLAVLAVDSLDAKVADVFKQDSKNPTLSSFKLDMNLQKVFLTFSETMKASTLLGPQITFHSTPAANGATPVSMQLAKGFVSANDSTILTLTMIPDDFNKLQQFETLATNKENTYMSITSIAEDMNGNTLTEITSTVAQKAADFADDEVAATLDYFDVDLTAETITLGFSETMDVTVNADLSLASFRASEVVLVGGSDIGGVQHFQLTGEIVQPLRADSTEIVVKLIKDDLEAIKSKSSLATGGKNDDDNTWISISNELVNDQSGVAVTAIASTDAKQVRTFNGDSTKPVLVSFTLDMADGKVALSFTETMKGADVLLGSMQIQNTNGVSADVTESVTLENGTYVVSDALTVDFTVSAGTRNKLKKFANLATDTTDTFLKLDAGAVKDMSGNSIAEQVLVAASVDPDDVRPNVLTFTTSMVTGSESVTITFDETMNRASLLVQHVHLANTVDGSDGYWAVKNSSSTSEDGTVIKIDIHTTDVDELKTKDICTTKNKCYLIVTADAIKDMSNLEITALPGQKTQSLDADITDPVVSSFVNFDYNEHTITMSFSEPVDPTTIYPEAIRLDSASNMDISDSENENFFYQLTGGNTSSPRGATIVIDVEKDDMNEIKMRQTLCIKTFGCFLRTTLVGAQNDEAFIKDTFGNPIVTVAASDQTRTSNAIQLDTTGPVLERFVINLEAGTLTMTFDEPVKAAALEPAELTLQSAEQRTVFHKLTGGTLNNPPTTSEGTVAEVKLLSTDILDIKAFTTMATEASDTYITLSTGVVFDLVNNANIALPDAGLGLTALVAADYTKDSTAPSMISFVSYDPSEGLIELSFDEPVDIASISYTDIQIQSAADAENGVAPFNLIKEGSIEYKDAKTKMAVKITLHIEDRDAVQVNIQLASGLDTTFISFAEGMIADVSGRNVIAVPASAGEPVQFYGEFNEASLKEFNVDLTRGVIDVTFTSAIDTGTFKPEFFTIQSEMNDATVSYSLTNESSTSDENGYSFAIQLSRTDLDELKKNRNLATGASTTYVSLKTELVKDVQQRPILPQEVTSAMAVTTYVEDKTAPELMTAEFNLDGDGTLTLSFSEVVDINEKALTAIVIQDAASPTVDSVRLTGGTVVESDVASTLTITLAKADLDAIKHVDGLAVSRDTTFISIDSTLINDMNVGDDGANAIVAKTSLNVEQGGFTQDNTAPTVTGFDLDMRTSMLYLTFSETVELASLTAIGGITFQDHKSSPSVGGSYTLQNAGTKDEVSETKLTLKLDDADMNAIKANTFLTPATTIFMIFADGAVTDPKPNNIEAIPSSNAVEATLYTSDNVDPELHPTKSFDLNMNDGYILMHFTETVKEDSFVRGSLTLYSDVSTAGGVKSHPISSNSLVEIGHADNVDSDYTTVRIALHKSDMDAIKNIPSLANNADNTHISFADSVFSDVDGNPLVGIAAASAKEAGRWFADATPPELGSFSLNMNTNTLTLNFNEPVDDSIVDYTAITIQSKANVNTVGATKVTLNGVESKTRSNDGMVITLVLNDTDINKKTKDEGLAISDGTTFISMTDTFVNDMAGVDIKPIADTAAQQTPNGGHTPDTTRPQLDSWDLDMTNAKLTLHFLETMKITSLEVDKMKLQASATVNETSVNGDVPTQVRLNGATVVANSEDGLDVVIQLTNDEMNELKKKNIARTAATAWLEILEDSIADMNGEKVNQLSNLGANALAVNAAQFVSDGKNPAVTEFDLNMNDNYGSITLRFSETVKASTFVAKGLMLVSGNTYDKSCPCSDCFDDEYILSDCTTTDDRVCALCEECAVGTFKANNCTANANTDCEACAVCDVGEFITEYCSGDTNTACGQCTDNCNECTGPGAQCTMCATGFFLSGQECVGSCPAGTYANNRFTGDLTGAKACFACDPICTTCSGPAATQCTLACDPLYDFDSNTCSNTCTNKAKLQPPQIQFKTTDPTNLCADCDASCASCDGFESIDCLSCPSGNVLGMDGSCAPTCTAGTFAIDGSCQACAAGCKLCTAINECTECTSPGSVLENGKCFGATVESEKTRLDAIAAQSIFDANKYNDAFRGDLTCTVSTTVDTFTLDSTVSTTLSLDGDALVVDIGFSDSNQLKAQKLTGVSDTTTFLAVASSAVEDMNGNQVDELDHLTVSCPDPCFGTCTCDLEVIAVTAGGTFTQDGTNPQLHEFDVDMDKTGLITITFTETVDVNTINSDQFLLQWKSDNVTESVALAGSTVAAQDDLCYNVACSSTQDVLGETQCGQTRGCKWDVDNVVCGDTHCGLVVEFTPTASVLNSIKLSRGLAITKETSYLSISNTPKAAVKDMVGRAIDEVETGAAKIARSFKRDKTPPSLVSYVLDMDNFKLSLLFSEVVDALSVTETKIFLEGADVADPTFKLQGNEGKSSADGVVIDIIITLDDMNAIKKIKSLAADRESTFLTFNTEFVVDTAAAPNAVEAVTHKPAQNYLSDTKGPVIENFDLNMATSVLTLSFSETVLRDSINVTALSIQNSAAAPAQVCPLAASVVQVDDSHVVRVTLDVDVMNEIKRLDQTCTTTGGDCFLVATDDAAKDMTNADTNKVEPVVLAVSTTSLQTAGYTEDTVDPKFVSFDLNMHDGELVVVFDETVDVSSLNVAAIELHTDKTLADVQTVALTKRTDSVPGGSSSSSADGTTVIIAIGDDDLDELKKHTSLAVANAGSVFLTATSATIQDMNGRLFVGVANKACRPGGFVPDLVKPTLKGFELDMDTRTVTLTFSETMKASDLLATEFVLQNAAQSAGDDSLRLIANGTRSQVDGSVLAFVFSEVDADFIKIRTSLCTKGTDTVAGIGTDCYMRLTEHAAKDMDGNNVIAIGDGAAIPLALGGFTADKSHPVLEGFDWEMPSGKPPIKLTLTFSETVDMNALSVNFIFIRDSHGSAVRLSSALTSQQVSNPRILELTVHVNDLASIRQTGSVGSTRALTWLSIAPEAIKDHAGNHVKEIFANDPLQVNVNVNGHSVDVTPPKVKSFELDLDSGYMIVYYEDASSIDATTVKPSKFTITNGIP
jgi:hypothetical protein